MQARLVVTAINSWLTWTPYRILCATVYYTYEQHR